MSALDRSTGDVLWTLGGKSGDVELPGTPFFFQHDARWQPGGTLTVFDDGGGPPRREKQSRVLRISPQVPEGTASVVASLTHPKSIISNSQGNAEILSNGNVFVGWGDQANMTEFDRDGKRTVYVTWNGDTRTASWRLVGVSATASSAAAPITLDHAAAGTFEDSLNVPSKARQLRVQALDAAGGLLATVSVR